MTRPDLPLIVDAVCSAFTGLLLLATVACRDRVSDWQLLALQMATALALFTSVTWGVRRMRGSFLAVALRTSAVIVLLSFLFGAVANLQHILVRGWMDDSVLTLERAVTGVDPSVWLQRLVQPLVTETMMFAYVVYVPLLPGVALLCYRTSGANAAYDYLLRLALADMACFIGFILLPVAGPLYHQRELYTVPLDGGFFTWCGEWIRHNAQYAGGSIPSPHCACSTVMLAMLHRYDRKSFWVALPVVLILYVATVYGRYHYAADGLIGILVATAVVSPALGKGAVYARARYRRNRIHWQRAH